MAAEPPRDLLCNRLAKYWSKYAQRVAHCCILSMRSFVLRKDLSNLYQLLQCYMSYHPDYP